MLDYNVAIQYSNKKLDTTTSLYISFICFIW